MTEAMRFERRMSEADALMWRIEKDPMLRSTITSVALLDRSPDRAQLEEKLERATRLVPRLRQRVVGNPYSIAPPRWELDPYFDLQYHLRFVRAPEPATLEELLRWAGPVAMQGFDRARPLWEFYAIDGLAGGQAAAVIKLHHAITDGVGAVRLAMALYDLERAPSPPLTGSVSEPAAPEARPFTFAQRVADAWEHERRRQLGMLRRLPQTAAQAVGAAAQRPTASTQTVAATLASAARLLMPASRPLSPIMVGRSLSVRFDTLSLPLDETKAAAKAAGGRLNDAFLAGIVGGLRAYHDHHGASIDRLRMSMPINIRTDATQDLAGNAFAPARFVVPVGVADPLARMAMIRDLVAQQRAEPALVLLEPLALLLFRLPASVSTAVFQSLLKGIDFVASNVPGVPVPVYLAGAEILSQFPFGPLSGAATNITLLSYRDQLHLGINTDPAAVPDGDVFTSCLRDGFDEILKVG